MASQQANEMPIRHPISTQEDPAKKTIPDSSRVSIKVVVGSCVVIIVLLVIPIALHFHQQGEWSRDLKALNQKYEELSTAVLAANNQIHVIQNKSEVSSLYSCAMKYNGKCFWIEYGESMMKIEKGRTICSDEGGRLANIYSSTHYYMLLRYLRMFGRGNDGWASAFLALTYNKDTNATSLSDGTTAPFLKWYPGYPRSREGNITYLVARSLTHRDSADQHMANADSTSAMCFGAICEK